MKNPNKAEEGNSLEKLTFDFFFGLVIGGGVRAIIDNSDNTPNEKAIPVVL